MLFFYLFNFFLQAVLLFFKIVLERLENIRRLITLYKGRLENIWIFSLSQKRLLFIYFILFYFQNLFLLLFFFKVFPTYVYKLLSSW